MTARSAQSKQPGQLALTRRSGGCDDKVKLAVPIHSQEQRIPSPHGFRDPVIGVVKAPFGGSVVLVYSSIVVSGISLRADTIFILPKPHIDSRQSFTVLLSKKAVAHLTRRTDLMLI